MLFKSTNLKHRHYNIYVKKRIKNLLNILMTFREMIGIESLINSIKFSIPYLKYMSTKLKFNLIV